MSTDEPSPNPAYDSLASSGNPAVRLGADFGRDSVEVVVVDPPSWLAAEAFARLERAALERTAAYVKSVEDAQVKPATVDVEVNTDKADMAVLDLQLELVELGHAKVKADAAGHVGLEVDRHLPAELHNRSVLVALNQRIARAGYAPRRRS